MGQTSCISALPPPYYACGSVGVEKRGMYLAVMLGILIMFPAAICILSSSYLCIFQVMENLDQWNFDVFKLHDVTQARPLLSVSYTIMQVRLPHAVSLSRQWVCLD